MKPLVLVVFLVVLVVSTASAYDWVTNPTNGHMYTIVDGFPWEEAEAIAVSLGGHLVTINDYEENQWVLTNVVQPMTSLPVWIGLHQLPSSPEPAEGWVWSSGEPVTYTHWQQGEPNQYLGLQEDWAEMFSIDPPRGYWNDVNLTMTRARSGVVEVVPEPSNLLTLCCGVVGLLAFRRRRK